MSRNPPYALRLLVVAALTPSLAAQVEFLPRWQAGGPDGGGGKIVFAPSDPERLYASSGAGLFSSTDDGLTWRPTGVSGLANLEITALAVDPRDADRVYVSPRKAGVFRSDDGGRSWHLAAEGLPSPHPWLYDYRSLNDLAVSRDAHGTVFASIWSDGGTGGALYLSRDRGRHWTMAVDIDSIRFVEVAPWPDESVYAAGAGFWRSTDAGTTWGEVPGLADRPIHALAFGPAGSGTIWAGSYGVYRSTDSGQTWSLHTAGLESPSGAIRVDYLAADVADPLRVYLGTWNEGTYRSTDGGLTWSRLEEPPDYACASATWNVFSSSAPEGPVLATTCDASVLRLQGDAWVRSGSGLHAVPIGLLAVDPESPAVAYAAAAWRFVYTPLGLYRTSDTGLTWRATTLGIGAREVWSVAVDPADPRHVLVSLLADPPLYTTTDGGDTWTAAALPASEPAFVAPVLFAPSDPLRVYAFRYFWESSPSDVLRSFDGGATWQALATDLSCCIEDAAAVDPVDPDVLYAAGPLAGSLPSASLTKSTDGGETWAYASSGLPRGPNPCAFPPCPLDRVRSLAIHPAHPHRIWAVTSYWGLYVSENGGGSWHPGTAPGRVGAVAVIRDEPDTVLVGDADQGGFFLSTDGGATWQDLGATSEPAPHVYALAASPAGNVVYAGTSASVLHLQRRPEPRRPAGRRGGTPRHPP